MIREQVKSAQVEAMKAGDKEKLAAVRLILAKLKDRDIELRTATSVPDDDAVVVDVLQKMVKQRRESARTYEEGGRLDLAERELAEVEIYNENGHIIQNRDDTICNLNCLIEIKHNQSKAVNEKLSKAERKIQDIERSRKDKQSIIVVMFVLKLLIPIKYIMKGRLRILQKNI